MYLTKFGQRFTQDEWDSGLHYLCHPLPRDPEASDKDKPSFYDLPFELLTMIYNFYYLARSTDRKRLFNVPDLSDVQTTARQIIFRKSKNALVLSRNPLRRVSTSVGRESRQVCWARSRTRLFHGQQIISSTWAKALRANLIDLSTTLPPTVSFAMMGKISFPLMPIFVSNGGLSFASHRTDVNATFKELILWHESCKKAGLSWSKVRMDVNVLGSAPKSLSDTVISAPDLQHFCKSPTNLLDYAEGDVDKEWKEAVFADILRRVQKATGDFSLQLDKFR